MNPENKRLYTLDPELEKTIETLLKERGVSFSDAERIAECVLLSSTHYVENPEDQTPWESPWAQIAQIAYYLPLNAIRSQAVLTEAKAVGFPLSQKLLDFGSGLGAGSFPWLKNFSSVTYIEQSTIARDLHKSFQSIGRWINEKEIPFFKEKPDDPVKDATALFSFSLTELQQLPTWALSAENLVLIEPATEQDGRKLLAVRKSLLEKGFSMWAPCTHQGSCPLL